jgi:DNA-binding transcriptional LysR family regulator
MRDVTTDRAEAWGRLDWNDVRIFLTVAESGSLSGASRILGMTQPTISRRMDDLELRLNARLLIRSPRGVALTPAGEAIHRLAAGMARLGESIVRDLMGKDRDEAGQVTLAAPDGVAAYLIMPFLGDFQRANPQIDLVLDCGVWRGALDLAEPDLTLEYKAQAPADRTSVPIAHVHYAYFASRDYLSTYGKPASFAEITSHRTVRHAAFREQKSTWNTKGVAVRELVGATLLTNSSAAMVEAVRAGAGIGAMPTAICEMYPDLVMLDLDPVAHPTLWLRHHPAAIESRRIQRLVDWLTQVFDPATKPWYRRDFIHPRYFPKPDRSHAPVQVESNEGRRLEQFRL